MAVSSVSSVQQVGQSVVDTGLSLFDKIYNNPFIHGLLNLLLALLLSGVLIFLSRIISIFVRNRISKTFVIKDGPMFKKMGVLVGDVIFYIMSFFSIYVAFTVADIDIKLLMSGITIGVGFAFRQTLSNMISGIVIFATDEYRIGNIVQLKFQGDVFGIIEEVNMKNVIIRTFDMRRAVIPNASFLKKLIRTYSSEEFLRLDAEVVVLLSIDQNQFISRGLEIINQLDFVINKQYSQIIMDSCDDKKIKFKAQVFFNPRAGLAPEQMKSAIQLKLLELSKNLVPVSAPKK